jgi:hypothetical protein
MKTIIFSLVFLGCLGLAGASLLYATDSLELLQKGKVLLLKNEHTMEGDIERVGDRYRVRRLIGETWVPVDHVLCLAASLPDAYAYLRSRSNLRDADERLRLANWCRFNGLHEQALAEVRAAAELRPDHAPTRRMLQYLEQAATPAAMPKPAPLAVASKPGEEPLPPVELTTDSLGLFATRVQPILMNTCANCHATGRGGKFRLIQAFQGGLANRKTLEQNLAAVLGQINLNQPELSRLLTKAVSDHARTGQAPLKNRRDEPYPTLEKWVKLTVANNPHLRDSLAPSAVPSMPATSSLTTNPEQHSVARTQTQWGADAQAPATPVSPTLPSSSAVPVPVSRTLAAPPPPPPTVGPVDPYDPEPFNRRLQPETNKPRPEK